MNTLKLEHVAPYLAYDVRLYHTSRNRFFDSLLTCETLSFLINSQPKDLKLALRPMSDLTKDEHFDLYMELCDELEVARCEHLLLALQDKSYYAFDISKLEILEKFMYRNHFDWRFNLIPQGLAVDVNNLK